MRKISIYRKYIDPSGILLIILMLPITIFAETPDTDGFFGAKWGMSVSQVREKFNFILTSPGVEVRSTQTGIDTVLILTEAKNILGCTVGIAFLFKFRNDELYRVDYHEEHPLAPWYPNFTGEEKATVWCGAEILSRYENEENSLYKRYGKPVKSEEYDKIWVLPSTSIATRFIRLKGKTSTSDTYFFSLVYEKR
jgi:hypothetical protein